VSRVALGEVSWAGVSKVVVRTGEPYISDSMFYYINRPALPSEAVLVVSDKSFEFLSDAITSPFFSV
jgi:hypothetical protein